MDVYNKLTFDIPSYQYLVPEKLKLWSEIDATNFRHFIPLLVVIWIPIGTRTDIFVQSDTLYTSYSNIVIIIYTVLIIV